MSGTQEENLSAKNAQFSTTEKPESLKQSGIEKEDSDSQKVSELESHELGKKLSPSQKMDMLLRGSNTEVMKKEIEKLRKEAAKYRVASKTEESQKLAITQKAKEIQKELEELRTNNRNLIIMRKLDKAGCIKSELVAKDIPQDCENLDSFIEKYKEENKFLFKTPKQNIGGTFKSSGRKNLSPSQRMDAYIRAALGR